MYDVWICLLRPFGMPRCYDVNDEAWCILGGILTLRILDLPSIERCLTTPRVTHADSRNFGTVKLSVDSDCRGESEPARRLWTWILLKAPRMLLEESSTCSRRKEVSVQYRGKSSSVTFVWGIGPSDLKVLSLCDVPTTDVQLVHTGALVFPVYKLGCSFVIIG